MHDIIVAGLRLALAQVNSLEQAKGQLEMMNDSYKVQLQEKDEHIEVGWLCCSVRRLVQSLSTQGLQEEVNTLEEEATHTQVICAVVRR